MYLKGRGLQLQHRADLRQTTDDTIMQRLISLQAQQNELEQAILVLLTDEG